MSDNGRIQVTLSNVYSNVLSVYVRNGMYRLGTGLNDQKIKVYNFDLKTGKLITNSELLKRLELDIEEIKIIMKDYYKNIGYSEVCDGYNENCYVVVDAIDDYHIGTFDEQFIVKGVVLIEGSDYPTTFLIPIK